MTLQRLTTALVLALSLAAPVIAGAQALPTGQTLTPLAAPGAKFELLRTGIGPNPDYVADGAAATALSPDGRTLLVLTSGFNRYSGKDGKIDPVQSQQYIFVYAVTQSGAVLKQTLAVPNSFAGLSWERAGQGFYVSGGVDDVVYRFAASAKGFARDAAPIKLGHKTGNGVDVKPQVAGLSLSPDGKLLLAANYYNDSVSLIDTASGKVIAEQDLRPGKIDPAKAGVAGGEAPFAVVWRDAHHAFVSCALDREIDALEIGGGQIRVTQRIPLAGEPTALLYDPSADRLYATEDNADRLAVLAAATGRLIAEPRLGFPAAVSGDAPLGKGLNPNGLAFGPHHTLWVTLGGINAVSVVAPRKAGAEVLGLIPTGWYPSAAAITPSRVFVVNRKSPPGPNPDGCDPKIAHPRTQAGACGAANQYIFQMEKAGLLQFPTPSLKTLAKLTLQVADNIGLSKARDRAAADAVMAQLKSKIKHVIFIIKENRTYDQVLGDLEIGNGDPRLAILGQAMTPNHHQLARQFVTFDNFYDSGEQSSTGWSWSTAARATDLIEKTAAVNYAGRGLAYDSEGTTRNVNTAVPQKDRAGFDPGVPNDPDLMPSARAITSPDGDKDDEAGQGYIWNAAIRAGIRVRNYGVADDNRLYDASNPKAIPVLRDPFKEGRAVYVSTDRALASRSDPYYRGFDQKLADYWRILEWRRDYDLQVAHHSVAGLTMMRIAHDHGGDFDTALDGVNTYEAEMADNDYAIGMVVDHVAHSPLKDSTLIFIIEDDAQGGVDHVDARRSLAYIVGPYVKQQALVSTRYTTVSLLRTIEGVLGLRPMGMNDALAAPMADAFDLNQTTWDYQARASKILRTTQLPLDPKAFEPETAMACTPRSSGYWAEAMKGQDFRGEDHLDTPRFNAALWAGLAKGPAPVVRGGEDLRQNRTALMADPAMRVQCP